MKKNVFVIKSLNIRSNRFFYFIKRADTTEKNILHPTAMELVWKEYLTLKLM